MTIGPRYARLLRTAALGAAALALVACGDDPPPREAAKPATQPLEQPAAKAPAPPPAPSAPEVAKSAPPADPCADAAVAEKVKSTLDTDRSLGALAVDVTAAAGTVTLFGTAESDASRRKAEQAAAGVPCVKSVQNRIVIVRGS